MDRSSQEGPVDAPVTSGQSVFRNIVTTLVGNAFPPVATLVVAPILAHVLAVEGRGALAAATAPFFLMTLAATMGLPEAVTYAVARDAGLARRATRSAAATLAVAGLVATGAVILLADWLSGGDTGLAGLIRLASAAVVPVLCLGAVRALAAGLHRWDLVARERIISSVVKLVAIVALAASGRLTPLTATVTLVAAPAAAMVAYLPLRGVLRHVPRADGGRGPERPALLGYGMRVWVGSLSGVLLARVDQLLLTPLAGVYELGIYVVAVNLSEVPQIVIMAVREVTFSAQSSSYSARRLTAAARLSGAAAAGVALAVGATMYWWVPVLFGRGFAPAVGVAAVMLAAVVVGAPGSIAGAALAARDRPGLRSTALVVACGVNLLLLVLLAPGLGALGAALATLAGAVVAAGVNLALLQRLAGVRWQDFFGLRSSDRSALVRMSREAVAGASARRRAVRP